MPLFALLNATVARRLALLGLATLTGLVACAGLGAAMAVLGRPAPTAYAAPAAQNLPFPGPCGATLQLCINSAAAGDTIVIAAGAYVTNITLNKAVSLTGVSSATVILGGNITGTAGFVSPAAGNYHLTSASSAVDAAANFGVFTDFDGQPRPMGPRFDMGYDEFDLVHRLLLPIIVRN